MNARYYMPGTGRFLSPDTLIPHPADGQAFNRYSYVYNNPLNFIDPSGHCAGSYNSDTGIATEDQECWDYLFSGGFCNDEGTSVCDNNDWRARLLYHVNVARGQLHYFFMNPWTTDALRRLSGALGDTIRALNGLGYDGSDLLKGIEFRMLPRGEESITFPSNQIGLHPGFTVMVVWHEIGHVLSFRSGHKLQNEYYEFATTASTRWYQYGLNSFCFRAYCHRQYPWWQQFYTGKNPEYWADAFAALIYMETYGSTPDSWIENGYQPNWEAIRRAALWSLRVTYR